MNFRVLIVDVETTGLDPRKDGTLEIGAILYSVTNKTALQQWSSLFYAPSNPVAHINNITKTMLEEMKDVETHFSPLWKMALSASALCAYNADFDKGFIREFVRGIKIDGQEFPSLPWICAMKSIKYTNPSANRKLVTVASAHGITLGGEHRALFDCQLVAQLFMRTPDLEEQLRSLLGFGGTTNESPVDKGSDDIA